MKRSLGPEDKKLIARHSYLLMMLGAYFVSASITLSLFAFILILASKDLLPVPDHNNSHHGDNSLYNNINNKKVE